MDLGWDLIDRSGWTGPNARKVYAARLLGAAAAIDEKLAAGADPLEEAAWVRYWQMQLAGSEVHQVARDANLQVARDVPALSRVMRVAEPGACKWCRTQASRGPVFHSEATALAVSHAHCRCHFVVVEDAEAIKVIRDAGAEAWQKSSLSSQVNPFTSWRGAQDTPAAYLPGARTPERLVSVRAQIASYEAAIPGAADSAWMAAQLIRLREELRELTGISAGDLPTPGSMRAASDDAVLRGVNPGYASGDRAYKVNCTYCVQAHEYRARGYEVEAKPGSAAMVQTGGRSVVDWLADWQLPGGRPVGLGEFVRVGTHDALIRDVESMPPGSRFIVMVEWASGGGHVFLAENLNGVARLLDSQSGLDLGAGPGFLGHVAPGQIWTLRVDTLEATDPERTMRW